MRRLVDEGVTFQTVLDEMQKILAIRYLLKSNLNNQQFAHLVGYRDPNAFQRAFRKWTGMTPQTLRQKMHSWVHIERKPPLHMRSPFFLQFKTSAKIGDMGFSLRIQLQC
ncbi:helix-turn-helix domain-containing protein [Marivivens sp. LCG002]|uniref:helix-turn-helix domain-containing protein n=1 Tax=Marivivens sp. LCG002 TaxID=3051171 RepID=UPI0025566A70|nr:helix-turn-helix domain-containing protein [Marivivens sp. LCG002]WIV49760.1 helix-turn-helix domain-containing protein [Marivivens sp. LCG002]